MTPHERTEQDSRFSRRTLLTLIAFITILTLSACGGQTATDSPAAQSTGVNIRIAGPFDVSTLDPANAASDLEAWVAGTLVFDRLFSLDAKGNLQLRLAAAPPLIDTTGRKVTLRLRPSLQFHNGRALTSADVAFTLERLKKSSASSQFGAALANIEEIRTVDELTLELQLSQPHSALPALLASPIFAIVPRSEILTSGNAFGILDVVGSGPFRIVEWNAGRNMRLARTASAQDARAPSQVDTIELTFNVASPVALDLFRNAQVDFAWFHPGVEELSALRQDASMASVLHTTPSDAITLLWINPRSVSLSDMQLRRTIAASIDRSAIAERTSNTHPADSLLIAADPSPIPSTSTTSTDISATIRNSSAAAELTLLSNEPPAAVSELVTQLERTGFRIRLLRGAPSSHAGRIDDGSIDLIYATQRTASPDPAALFGFGPQCDQDELLTLCTAEISSLVQSAQALSFDSPDRAQLYRTAAQSVMTTGRVIPVLSFDLIHLCKGGTTSCSVDPQLGLPILDVP